MSSPENHWIEPALIFTTQFLTRLFFIAEWTLVRVVPEKVTGYNCACQVSPVCDKHPKSSSYGVTVMVNWFLVGTYWVTLDMIDDAYVQSILPLQWRFVGRQVKSLHGVKPDGHEELVRHRLERGYFFANICCCWNIWKLEYLLHGVNPDGQEELFRHRLEREYLLQTFVVVEIFGN